MGRVHRTLAGVQNMTINMRRFMESKDPVLWEDEWLQVKMKDDWYTYTHSIKSNGGGVAVLAYSKDPLMILGRYENTPPHGDGIALASLTGMMDKEEEDALTTAVRELEEEGGYKEDKGKFLDLGTVRPSKSSDTIIYMFACEVEHKEGKMSGEGDGTQGEADAYCKFISLQEAIDSKDALLATMVARLLTREIL